MSRKKAFHANIQNFVSHQSVRIYMQNNCTINILEFNRIDSASHQNVKPATFELWPSSFFKFFFRLICHRSAVPMLHDAHKQKTKNYCSVTSVIETKLQKHFAFFGKTN